MSEDLLLFDSLVNYFGRNPLWKEKDSFIPYLLKTEIEKAKLREEFKLEEKEKTSAAIKESYLFNLLSDFLEKNNINDPIFQSNNRIAALINEHKCQNLDSEDGKISELFDRNKRVEWIKNKGFDWWQNSSLEERSNFNLTEVHKPTKTTIQKFHIEIQDFSLLTEADNRFLKTKDSASDCYFVYAVWNKANNSVKLGRTRNLWPRVKSHVDSFIKYGQAKESDIFVCVSRFCLPFSSNAELTLLKTFAAKLDIKASAGNEFFHLPNILPLEKKQEVMNEVFEAAFSSKLYFE